MPEQPPTRPPTVPVTVTVIKLAWCCLLASVVVAGLMFPVVGGFGLLSNRASDALITPEEKAKLAAEIMAALNQPLVPNLPSLKISSVMFTTFMLQ